jgi:small subunit ribosomal protein S19
VAKRKKRFMTPKAARRRTRKLRARVSQRRKKQFTYRGHSLEELQAMPLYPVEESADDLSVVSLLSARARRTLGRGISTDNEHLRNRVKTANGRPVRTHRRDMLILPEFVNTSIHIHNGQGYTPVDIKPEMIGHYLGEYAITRRGVTHSGPGVGATKSSKHVPLK